jgi:hypothetical protein
VKPSLFVLRAIGIEARRRTDPGVSRGRVTRQGKAHEIGLGAVASVPVMQARSLAADLRSARAAGEDPRAYRDRLHQQEALKEARSITFKTAAERYIEANKAGWRNAKHAAQWTATLKTYAYPTLGSSAIADVAIADVLKVLTPIWSAKPETASSGRSPSGSVFT